jgi:hypothetical protein
MADNDDQNQEVNYAEYSDSDIQGYIQQKEQEINSYLNQCAIEEKSQSFCISYL